MSSTFNVDPAHEHILGRLIGYTIKQVETEDFKVKGKQLDAPLLRSPL